MLQRLARNHLTHHQRKNRRREGDTRPEAARHVLQLGVDFFRRGVARLEGHPTDRAGARPVADDLRVHRTRIFDLLALGSGSRRLLDGSKVPLRIGLERSLAPDIAEVVRLSLVVDPPRRTGRIDGHPANRVLHHLVNTELHQFHNTRFITDSQ